MVLTNRVDHLKALLASLKPKLSCDLFTLHGRLSSKERREAREAIGAAADDGRPFILIAIDKVAGEGLDIPAIDTLFLTMPVSFKGRIIQQVGRVTRDAENSAGQTIVHDFRDAKVPLLERMHRRRRRILEKEGFTRDPVPTITGL